MPDTLLRQFSSLALMPLIVPQGLYVKFRASQLQEADGPRSGTRGSGPLLRVLIIGDSSAAGVGVATQSKALAGQFVAPLAEFYTVQWHLQARCGATTASTIDMLSEVPTGTYDVVLVALGVNDVKNGVSLRRYVRRTARLYDQLVADFNVRLIAASGMPPVQDFPLLPDPLRWALHSRAQVFDAAHRDLINARPACRHLKGPARLAPELMATDGFHPGPAIYREWGQLAADLVMRHWPDRLQETQAE